MKKLKCGCGRVIGQYEWVDCEFKIVCVSCLNKQSALSRESAYRAALETIEKGLVMYDPFLWARDVARAALDRGQEEPVGREELAAAIRLAVRRCPTMHEAESHLAERILTTFRVERRG